VGGDDGLVAYRVNLGEERFPQERPRGYRSDVANRLETQMKNAPFPAIADGTDV
jgi:hypothetical protein